MKKQQSRGTSWHGENVLHFEASMNVTLGVPRIKEMRQFGGMRRCAACVWGFQFWKEMLNHWIFHFKYILSSLKRISVMRAMGGKNNAN